MESHAAANIQPLATLSLQLKPTPVKKWSSSTYPLPLKKHDKRKKERFQFLLKISGIALSRVGCQWV